MRAEDKVQTLNLGDLIKQRCINIVTVFLSKKASADFVSWLCSFMVTLTRQETWSNEHWAHACLRHHTDRDFTYEHHWGIERGPRKSLECSFSTWYPKPYWTYMTLCIPEAPCRHLHHVCALLGDYSQVLFVNTFSWFFFMSFLNSLESWWLILSILFPEVHLGNFYWWTFLWDYMFWW